MKKHSILYIDKNKDNLKIFQNSYKEKYNIHTCLSDAEGLHVLKNHAIALVLVNQCKDVMAGVRFIESIIPKWPNLSYALFTKSTTRALLPKTINTIEVQQYRDSPLENDLSLLLSFAVEASLLRKSKAVIHSELPFNQEKLSKIVTTSLDAIITIDKHQNIVMVNKSTEKMFGYDKSELLNRPLTILIPKATATTQEKYTEYFTRPKFQSKWMGTKTMVYGRSSSNKMFPIETTLSQMEINGDIYFNATIRDISKIVESEQLLRQSEEKFRGVFNSMIDVFSRVNNAGVVEMVSPSVYHTLGYKMEELIGKKAINYYVNPSDRVAFMNLIKEKGECRNFEFKIKTKSGAIKTVSSNAKVYKDKEGNILGIESVIRDITSELNTLKELKANQELLEDSQRIANLGHIEWHIPTNKLRWSNEIYRLYGIDFSIEPDLDFIFSLVHPDDLEYVKENLDLAIKQVKTYNIEHRLIQHNTGEVLWVHAQARLEFDSDNQPLYLMGTVLNITQKKHDETALKKSEEEFRSLAESAPMSILKIDKNYTIKYINHIPEGVKREDIIGTSLQSLLPKKEKKRILSIIDTVFETKVANQYEVLMEDDPQHKTWYSTVLGPILKNGKVDDILLFSTDISDKKKVEHTIKKQVKWNKQLLETTLDGYILADQEGIIIEANESYCKMVGYDFNELVGMNIRAIELTLTEEMVAVRIEQMKKNGKSRFETQHKHKNGRKIYLDVSVSVISLDNSSPLIAAFVRNITEQVKAQEILTALTNVQNSFIAESSSKESFEKILNTLLDVTQSEYGFIGEVLYKENQPYLKTHAITNIAWNKETSDFYEKNAPKGLEFMNMRTLFGRVITSRAPVIANDPYNDPRRGGLPPGHPRMNSFLGLPFFSHKELVGMIGIANKPGGYHKKDIKLLSPFLATCSTLIKAYQNAMDRQNIEKKVAALADIVSYSNDGIISTNLEGNVVSWNAGAEKILGYAPSEMLGLHVGILVPPQLKEAQSRILQKVSKGVSIENHETQRLTKDGVLVDVNMSIFPVIDDTNKVKGISAIMRDISEQKEARIIKEEFTKNLKVMVRERTAELEKTQKELALSLEKEKDLGELKSRFVSTASHQFRTPLTVIQSNMGILFLQIEHMDEKLKLKFEKVYYRIKDQITRMTNLMNDVLILGKINTGNIKPILKPTKLVELCAYIIANHNDIQSDGRVIEITVTGKPYLLTLDSNLLDHALSGLISNAFKYSVGKPSPFININFKAHAVEIIIEDYGIGISEQDIKHLFEPFFRASNVKEIKGTGLGTAIAKEYIELNGGTVSVQSKLNQGTKFIITFTKTPPR